MNKYNQKYKDIKNNYIANSVFEEHTTESYINALMSDLAKTLENMKEEYIKDMNKIIEEKNDMQYIEDKENTIEPKEEKVENSAELKSNNTLLISEKLGKVVLPYRAEEVLEILKNENNKYNSADEVIEDKFVRKLSDFKIQFASRYKETMKLARERENYSFGDAVLLATEMMKKRFLHPAIISACRTLNELDVYLDCLDKNELEDFKIFKIQYELYPMVIKHNKIKKGRRYKNNLEFMI